MTEEKKSFENIELQKHFRSETCWLFEEEQEKGGGVFAGVSVSAGSVEHIRLGCKLIETLSMLPVFSYVVFSEKLER